jgi:hypothetical protein
MARRGAQKSTKRALDRPRARKIVLDIRSVGGMWWAGAPWDGLARAKSRLERNEEISNDEKGSDAPGADCPTIFSCEVSYNFAAFP